MVPHENFRVLTTAARRDWNLTDGQSGNQNGLEFMFIILAGRAEYGDNSVTKTLHFGVPPRTDVSPSARIHHHREVIHSVREVWVQSNQVSAWLLKFKFLADDTFYFLYFVVCFQREDPETTPYGVMHFDFCHGEGLNVVRHAISSFFLDCFRLNLPLQKF